MEKEVKAHLRELYIRQQKELNSLSSLRLKLFENGLYELSEEINGLESIFSEFNRRITNYFEIEKAKFSSTDQNTFLRDNVD